jgi:inosine/xanthosine triphosphatase
MVSVGSSNPVKIESTRQAFERMWPMADVTVAGCPVASGVSPQPMSDAETRKGARQRAHRARLAQDADFGVGLEGGLHRIDNQWLNSGWVCVVDREGREGIGTTIGMIVPPALMSLIERGHELGDACDIVFKDRNTKQGAGYFGLMTNGAIDRTGTFRDAIIAALAIFLHQELMEEELDYRI